MNLNEKTDYYPDFNMIYEDLKINDIILIPKGTDIWCIKLQQTITLYGDIIARITALTTDKESIFVIPQDKILPIMYLDFQYNNEDQSVSRTSPSDQEYKDNTTFGELHYIFNDELYTNNDRLQKLQMILQ